MVLAAADMLVCPIEDEDSSLALIRFENGALGQVEINWTFQLDHFLRAGFEMFTAAGQGGYAAEPSAFSRIRPRMSWRDNRSLTGGPPELFFP